MVILIIFNEFLCDPGAIELLSFKPTLNRACGNDNIFAEHIRYAYESIFFHLSVFFNACIIHGYIPKSFLSTTIVPALKNKSGDVRDVSNYRPIALATITSKLFESVVLQKISEFLSTRANQ